MFFQPSGIVLFPPLIGIVRNVPERALDNSVNTRGGGGGGGGGGGNKSNPLPPRSVLCIYSLYIFIIKVLQVMDRYV